MEERPPIWRAAASILNKQSRTTVKGWSSGLGVGRGANNSSPYNVSSYEMFTQKTGSSWLRIGTGGGYVRLR